MIGNSATDWITRGAWLPSKVSRTVRGSLGNGFLQVRKRQQERGCPFSLKVR